MLDEDKKMPGLDLSSYNVVAKNMQVQRIHIRDGISNTLTPLMTGKVCWNTGDTGGVNGVYTFATSCS